MRALALACCIAMQAIANPAEQSAMDATQAACDAFRTGDVAAAGALLAPEFVLVDGQGNVTSRAASLEAVRRREPRYEVFRNLDMEARVYGARGDTAVVRGITHVKGTAGGKPFEARLRFTDTLVRDAAGRWRLVVSHASRGTAD